MPAKGFSGCARCVVGLLVLVLFARVAVADEQSLVDGFNKAIGLINDAQYDQGRKALDAFAKEAQAVKQGDAAYDRARELLERLPDLYRLSYYNSSIDAGNKAREAAAQGELSDAAGNWQQVVKDLEQLAESHPDEPEHGQRLAEARKSLSQVDVLQAHLSGEPAGADALRQADLAEPETLFDAAVHFQLPSAVGNELVALSDGAPGVLVVDLWQSGDPSLPMAAAMLQGLQTRYAQQGLRAMAVVLDTDGLARLAALMDESKADFPLALDDLAEFHEHYMSGGVRLPALLVFTRDRRVLRITGDDRLASTAALFETVQREVTAEVEEMPQAASPFYPRAEPISTVSVEPAGPPGIHFDERPAILLVTNANDSGRHLEALSAVAGEFGPQGLNVIAAIHGDEVAEIREFAARTKGAIPVHWLRSTLPSCYGPNQLRMVLVTGAGRVLKVMPIYSGSDQYAELLSRYARILLDKGYPAAVDSPLGANLAHRAHGGRVEAAGQGVSVLVDGLTGEPQWPSAVPGDVVVSFLNGQAAAFNRLVLDVQTPSGGSLLRDIEVLAADARGPFRRLARLRCEDRPGLQAFDLPRTSAARLKLVFETRFTGERGGDQVALGEIAVLEAAAANDELAGRLKRHFAAEGIHDDFANEDLAFWEQVEYFPGMSDSTWRVEQGQLIQSGAPLEWTYRSSALLHPCTEWGDYVLQATLEGNSTAAGLMVGFVDWDHFDRLVLLQGQNPQTGNAEGNSIRLERCREGQVRVLSLHGEPFPLDKPVRLQVVRQGDHLAVQAQGKWIMHAQLDPAVSGRVGLFASGSHGYRFDDVRLQLLGEEARVELPRMNPLSTAQGASIAWLSSQDDEPSGWASNLLRTPVFSPPGVWRSTSLEGQPPEVVFAFHGGQEVAIDRIAFDLPGGAARARSPEAIEVLVSTESALRGFRSVGKLEVPRRDSNRSSYSLDLPAVPCRYLMVRLPSDKPGEQFELAGVSVELTQPSAGGSQPPSQVERTLAALDQTNVTEQEPNDELASAQELAHGQAVIADIESGQVDLFRISEPPAGGGMLRLTIEALPWLRLKAGGLDAAGRPLPAPLADSPAAQRATQMFSADEAPRYVRVQMPAGSLALVIDTSGSMSGREADVNRAVETFLKGVDEDETVEVIRFANDVERLAPFTSDGARLVAAVEGKLRMDGATALYAALLEAAGDLAGRVAPADPDGGGRLANALADSRAIVLLSDGMNTIPGATFADVCLELKRRPVPLWVVAIGVDLHLYDPASGNTAHDLLRNLAEQSQGRFMLAPDSALLGELYESIAAEMRSATRYRLEAVWEALPTIDRSRELAVSQGSARLRPNVVLPPAAMELAAADRSGGAVPRMAPPPAAAELAPGMTIRQSPVLRGYKLPGAWESAPPDSGLPRGPLDGMLPPLPGELAPVHASGRPDLAMATLPRFGNLRVVYQSPDGSEAVPPSVMPAVELILDSSHSMAENMGRQTKLEVARGVVDDLIAELPDGLHLGLRLYGHWGVWILRRTDPQAGPLPNTDPRLNKDSELVEPIGPLTAAKRDKLRYWLDWTRPRGNTPMVFSLLEARKDFDDVEQESKTVVLISDGKETCGGKLEDVEAAYRGGNIGMVIHVVGFDIREPEARRQLEELARLGGGSYFDARDARQLGEALEQAVQSTDYLIYRLADEQLHARGALNGAAVDLEIGSYRVVPPGGGQATTIEVLPARSQVLTLADDGSLRPESR